MKNKHDQQSINFLIGDTLGDYQSYSNAKRGLRILLRSYACKNHKCIMFEYYFKHIKTFPFIIGEYTNAK